MNCTELEREWLDRDLNLSANGSAPAWSTEAEQHFADCTACLRLRAADASLDRAVSQWRAQPVPLPSTEQLLAAIWSDQRQTPTVAKSAIVDTAIVDTIVAQRRRGAATPRQFGSWTTAAAAMALAVLGLGLLTLPDRGEVRLAVRTPSPTAIPAEASSALITDTMALLWNDVRTNSAAAARTTVASFEHLPAVPLQNVVSEAMHSETEPVDTKPLENGATTAESERPWHSWGSPLGHQVGSAFRFLGNALPNEAAPAS